jgi:hypothetical protein
MAATMSEQGFHHPQAAELLRSSLKRLYKNAIPYSDTGFIIAFLSTANEDA